MSAKKLLIVDDSKVSRMMLSALVKDKNPELELMEAENADDAQQKIEGIAIDYFSVDLNMPGLNGLELIEILKPKYPNSSFALFTANIQDSTHEQANALDICCVNKPITDESVTKMLEYFNV